MLISIMLFINDVQSCIVYKFVELEDHDALTIRTMVYKFVVFKNHGNPSRFSLTFPNMSVQYVA